MGAFDELLREVLSPPSPKDRSRGARIDALESEVAKLRGAVVVLAQVLYENDAFGRVDREKLRSRLMKELRPLDDREPIPEGGDLSTCAACGKLLYEDDPELSLQTKGRVCMSCFQRGD